VLRYFFDEHVPSAIADQLIARGIDVLTAHAAGLAHRGTDDTILLRFATSQGRVMITADRDFVALAYSEHPHEGVVLLQRRLSVGDYVEYLELMARVTEPQQMRDQLVYCDW